MTGFLFVFPQQSIVDQDAGQLGTDGTKEQRRRHRGIDAAGESADDAVCAHFRANAVDRFVRKISHGPGTVTAANVGEEVLQQLVHRLAYA